MAPCLPQDEVHTQRARPDLALAPSGALLLTSSSGVLLWPGTCSSWNTLSLLGLFLCCSLCPIPCHLPTFSAFFRLRLPSGRSATLTGWVQCHQSRPYVGHLAVFRLLSCLLVLTTPLTCTGLAEGHPVPCLWTDRWGSDCQGCGPSE